MKYIFLGNYSNAGLEGFIKNPSQDRKSVISSMMNKAGGTMDSIYLTRGNYDVVVIGDEVLVFARFYEVCIHKKTVSVDSRRIS